MVRGFSLVEVVIVLLIVAVVAAIGLPSVRPYVDRIATDQAARDITTAIAVGRHGAVMQATHARVTIAADTVRVDRLKVGTTWGAEEWEPYWRQPGPTHLRVMLEVSNPQVVFGPKGLGWAASNTKVVLRRGSQVETITVSRLGRVKRW